MDAQGPHRGLGQGAGTPLLVIVGPTASGKTELAIEVAERIGGEIISADSMQVYRELNIGTAKPGPRERMRVPHHLLDVAELDSGFSVASFQRMAYDAIADVASRGGLPILAGGTGLYVKAVLDGYYFGPMAADLKVRRRLADLAATKGARHLHDRLMSVDPEAARRIHVNDLRRTIRALEVYEATGKPLTSWERERMPEAAGLDFKAFGLNRSRDAMRRRIRRRVGQMMERGLVDEVAKLLDEGRGPVLRRLKAIAYVEIMDFLEGKCTLTEAQDLVVRNTLRFAKRQMTWFRADPRIRWLDLGDDTLSAVEGSISQGQAVEIISRAGKKLLA